jgi:hypothetical protein
MSKNKRPNPPSPVLSPTACTPSNTKKTHLSNSPGVNKFIEPEVPILQPPPKKKNSSATVQLMTFDKIKAGIKKNVAPPAPQVPNRNLKVPTIKSKGGKKGSGPEYRVNPSTGQTVEAAGGRWSKDEDKLLRDAVEKYGPKNWKKISEIAFGCSRTDVQCLHRWQKVLKPGLVKGPWTPAEDKIVSDLVLKHGVGNIKWSVIAAQLPGRLGKQARERWYNHLDTSLNKDPWTKEEDEKLMALQKSMGNRWCEIAKLLTGRSENAVKNRWNSAMRKRAQALKNSTGGGSKKNSKSKASKSSKGKKDSSKQPIEKKKTTKAAKGSKKTSRSQAKKDTAKKSSKAKASSGTSKATKKRAAKKKTKKENEDNKNNFNWEVDDDIMKDFNFDIGFEGDMLPVRSPPPELSSITADFFDSPEPRSTTPAGQQKRGINSSIEYDMNWAEAKLDGRLSTGSEFSYLFTSDEKRKKRISLDSEILDVSVSPTIADMSQLRMSGSGRNIKEDRQGANSSPIGLFNKNFSKSPNNPRLSVSPSKSNFILSEDVLDKISANWSPSDMMMSDDLLRQCDVDSPMRHQAESANRYAL